MSVVTTELPGTEKIGADIITQAAVALPGATKDALELELNETLKHFFTRSHVWRDWVGPFHVRAGKAEVHLDPLPDGLQICFVYGAKFKDTHLSPRLSVPSHSAEGPTPHSFVMRSRTVLLLQPTPSQPSPASLWVYAALAPARADVPLPADVALEWQDNIKSGLMARMMQHRNRPYSDLQGAAWPIHQRKYFDGVRRARVAALHAFTQTKQTWRYHLAAARGSNRR